jgi:glycosyltransferase involved in cell wall biosynthesis
MKILNVNHTMDPMTGGGTAERTLQMSRYLVLNRIQCSVLTLDTHLPVERISFLQSGHFIALPPLLKRFFIPKASYGKIKRIVEDSDIVHLMGHWTILNAMVYLAARSLDRPYVFCPAGALPIFGRSRILKKIYNWLIGRKIANNAAKCIAITENEKADFLEYGVNENKIVMIPNGVDESDFTTNDDVVFRKKYALGTRPFILFVGRLNLIKGPDLLLHAFCQIKDDFPDFDLVFVGPDGGLLQQLKDVAKKFAVEHRVFFLGYLGGDDKSYAYHAATFLAIPSRHEAMSIVVLEAGICGTPSLFTDQCGLNEVAEKGHGWMTPASVEGLKLGLMSALSDTARLLAMKQTIRAYVSENFSWHAVIKKYILLYEELLKPKSASKMKLPL